MTTFTRRNLALAAFASLALTAACGNGVGNTNPQKIDARVDATLGHLFQEFPESREVSAKSVATLVMPVIKADWRQVGKRARYSPYQSTSRIESVVTISATSGRPVRR